MSKLLILLGIGILAVFMAIGSYFLVKYQESRREAIRQQQSPVIEKAPAKVEFVAQGLKIGDKITDEFLRGKSKGAYRGDEYTLFETIEVGSVKIDMLYQVYKDELHGLGMFFPSEDFSRVVEAYTEKLGKPDHRSEEILQNRMSAKFRNETVSWDCTAGKFYLEKHGDTITEGHGSITSEELKAVDRKKSLDEKSELSKKL